MEAQVKYMLLIYLGEAWDQLGPAERQRIYGEQMTVADEVTARGKYLGGSPLQPASTATSVRVRGGKRVVTDGPFAETREQLGGYMIVDVENLDEAIAIAARGPVASVGTVEVRPIREGPPT
jgi:hypothetical protein